MFKLFLLLSLAFFSFLSSCKAKQGFININCGGESFISTTGLEWESDDKFITSGQIGQVENVSSTSLQYSTLRSFPQNQKNCYRIPVKQGRRHLVQAKFHYGNYDKKNLPPSFDLYIENNYWGTLDMDMDGVYYHEVIYVVHQNAISLCLVKTDEVYVPFINSISIRELDESMYNKSDPEKPLFLYDGRRYAFGSPVERYDYPEDDYFRNWINNDYKGTKNITIKPSSRNVTLNFTSNKPPSLALKHAVTSSSLDPLPLPFPSTTSPLYIAIYFAELDPKVKPGQRSFHVRIDNTTHSRVKLSPKYANASEIIFPKVTGTNVSLIPAKNSTYPPIVSAMEVLEIGDTLIQGTNTTDVKALAVFQERFTILKQWNGDPCLPTNYSWEWVACNSDTPPQVISINLSGYGLEGTIPNFGNMTALESIYLSNNKLNGTIPDFLFKLPKLKTLDLSYNNLREPLPSSKPENLNFTFSGNLDIISPSLSPSLTSSGKNQETEEVSRRTALVLSFIFSFFCGMYL